MGSARTARADARGLSSDEVKKRVIVPEYLMFLTIGTVILTRLRATSRLSLPHAAYNSDGDNAVWRFELDIYWAPSGQAAKPIGESGADFPVPGPNGHHHMR